MESKIQKSPRYLIIDHFDEIVNKLNQHVETLIWPTIAQNEKEAINRQRDYLLDLIKNVRDYNINEMHRNDNPMGNDEKIKRLIETKDNMSLIKTFFIKNDCYLIKDLSSSILYSLLLTNWFINKDQVEFFK
jgi:hypothetical protein